MPKTASSTLKTTFTSLTGDYRIDSLLGNQEWGTGFGTGVTLIYSFHNSASTYDPQAKYMDNAPYNNPAIPVRNHQDGDPSGAVRVDQGRECQLRRGRRYRGIGRHSEIQIERQREFHRCQRRPGGLRLNDPHERRRGLRRHVVLEDIQQRSRRFFGQHGL